MFEQILTLIPSAGLSNMADETSIQIDTAFMKVMKTCPKTMFPFVCGIYSAYVSMTVSGAYWDDIHFMIKAANDWTPEDLKDYSKGRAI